MEPQANENPQLWPETQHEGRQPPSGDEKVHLIDDKHPGHGEAPVVENSAPAPYTGGNGTGGTAEDLSTSVRGQILGPGTREGTVPYNATVHTGSLFHETLKYPAFSVHSEAAASGAIYGHISGDILDSVSGKVCGDIEGAIVVNINGWIHIAIQGRISAEKSEAKCDDDLFRQRSVVKGQSRFMSSSKPKSIFMSKINAKIKAQIKGDVHGYIHGNIHGAAVGYDKTRVYGQIQGCIKDKVDAQTHRNIQGDIYGSIHSRESDLDLLYLDTYKAKGDLVFEKDKDKASGLSGVNLDESMSDQHSEHPAGTRYPKTDIENNATIAGKHHETPDDRLTHPLPPGPDKGDAKNAEPCWANEIQIGSQRFELDLPAIYGETWDIDNLADGLERAKSGQSLHISPQIIIEERRPVEVQASGPLFDAKEDAGAKAEEDHSAAEGRLESQTQSVVADPVITADSAIHATELFFIPTPTASESGASDTTSDSQTEVLMPLQKLASQVFARIVYKVATQDLTRQRTKPHDQEGLASSTAGSSSQQANQSHQSNKKQASSRVSTSTRRKRSSPDSGDEALEGSKTSKKQNTRNDADSLPYACFYLKANQHRHSACAGHVLRTPGAVRQHLRRQHKKSKYLCPTCYQEFKDAGVWRIHLRERTCTEQPDPDSSRMTQDTFDETGKKREEDEITWWYRCFKLLFPEVKPLPASPYADITSNSVAMSNMALELFEAAGSRAEAIYRVLQNTATGGSFPDLTQPIVEEAWRHFRRTIEESMASARDGAIDSLDFNMRRVDEEFHPPVESDGQFAELVGGAAGGHFAAVHGLDDTNIDWDAVIDGVTGENQDDLDLEAGADIFDQGDADASPEDLGEDFTDFLSLS